MTTSQVSSMNLLKVTVASHEGTPEHTGAHEVISINKEFMGVFGNPECHAGPLAIAVA